MSHISAPSAGNIRYIAFYLPQFHPTPENDRWWGKGFTEWTNVTKAAPLFAGHYQPHLPTESGFYDLRVKETRIDQINLAKEYGIDGFCYHYYWFSGTKILNQPVDAMLADKEHDMPFCLCWANENWTRQWDAAEHEILIAQKYQPEDDLNFIKSLIPFFSDARYIRVDGKPFLIVYRPQHLPDSRKSIETWRNHCRDVGIGEIHVCCALTHGNMDHRSFGFDSGVEFPPHNLAGISGTVDKSALQFYGNFTGTVVQYKDVADLFLTRDYPEDNVFKGVFPSWDNTARRGPRSFVVLNGTPANYEFWLKQTVSLIQRTHPNEDRLLFINAWNEWAEGCHLEPDRVYGRQFLEATKRVKQGSSELMSFSDVELPKGKTEFLSDLIGSTTALEPVFVSTFCFWLSHLPFLHWLIATSQPKRAVCVNVDTGNAVLNTGIWASRYNALATTEGSIREATSISSILLGQHSDRVAVSVQDEVNFLAGQPDHSIDLLIFDDFHSVDALRKAYSLAKQKLSDRGIILMHDIFVGDNPCHAFWDEVKTDYPSFTFSQSHGLGVLLVGASVDPRVARLVDADVANQDWNFADYFFQAIGARVEAQAKTMEIGQQLKMASSQVSELKAGLATAEHQLHQLAQTPFRKVTRLARQVVSRFTG